MICKKNGKKIANAVVAAVLGMSIISTGTFSAACSKKDADKTKPAATEETTEETNDANVLTMGMDGNSTGSVAGIADDLGLGDVSDTSAVPDAASSWTVMVYMCGSNLESGNGFGSLVLDRMDNYISSDNVNVIVETGGTSQWRNSAMTEDAVSDVNIPADALGRYQVKQNEIIDLGSVPLDSMGKAETLGDFISWTKQNYPAQKYALVLWNHGYVEPYGNLESDDIFMQDEDGNIIYYTDVKDDQLVESDCLNLQELDQALTSGGVHFESMIFNTCLSSSIEIATAVAPHANYMVSSEESIPAIIGIPEQYIDFLNKKPESNGKELGDYIVNVYEDALKTVIANTDYDVQGDGMFSKSTMACIDLKDASKMWEYYAEVMRYVYYSTYDINAYTGFLNAASGCENYGSHGNVEGNLIDLKSFLVNAAPYLTETNADENLISLIESDIYAKNGPARSSSFGLSCYYPNYNYIFNLKASIEGELIAGGYSYTEDQLNAIVSYYVEQAMDGYFTNIQNNDQYYWIAAYLDYRMENYWDAPSSVATAIENHVDETPTDTPDDNPDGNPDDVKPPVIPDGPVINAGDFKVDYETWIDDNGKLRLKINDGADGIMTVRMNYLYEIVSDNKDSYDALYTYFGATDTGVDKDANGEYYNIFECEWYYFGNKLIPVYTIESTDKQTIYGFRAKVNDEDCVVAFVHDKATDKCNLLYACRVEESTGLASNDIFQINEGDVVDIIFFTYTSGDPKTQDFADYLLIRPFYSVEYTADTKIVTYKTYSDQSEITFYANYTIVDAFGNTYYTDFIRYDIANGKITKSYVSVDELPDAVCNELYGVV